MIDYTQQILRGQTDPALRRVFFVVVDANAEQTRVTAGSLGAFTCWVTLAGAEPIEIGTVVELDAALMPGVFYVQFAEADVREVCSGVAVIRNSGGTVTMEPREMPFEIVDSPTRGLDTNAGDDVSRLYFLAVKSTSLLTRLTAPDLAGGTWSVYLSKNGDTPTAPTLGAAACVHEVDATNAPGLFYVQLIGADRDTAGALVSVVRNTGGANEMEPREGFIAVSTSRSPSLGTATTAESIRDRAIAVIERIAPSVLVGDPFHKYLNEGGADFQAWAEANPTGAWRRFQVRDTGADLPPEVSNADVEERTITLRVLVAYPQSHRAGSDNALDRDDAMSTDQHRIEHAIGMCGRSNFAPPYPDACWRSGSTARIKGNGVDFLEIVTTYSFQRSF